MYDGDKVELVLSLLAEGGDARAPAIAATLEALIIASRSRVHRPLPFSSFSISLWGHNCGTYLEVLNANLRSN